MKISKWRMALIALAAVVVSVPLLMAQQSNEGQDSSGADRAQSQAQQRAQRRAQANEQGQFQIGEDEEEEENRRRR